jgi:hypothetical protein
VVPQQLGRRGTGPPVDRSRDRLVALASTVVAAGYLVASVIAVALPDRVRHGIWLPLHLALAGAAVTAIAGIMPFFVAAFAAAPPADTRLRAAAVAAVALGAAIVAIGVSAGVSSLPVAGGLLLMLGIVATGAASLRLVVRALGASRGLVTRAYLLALVAVGLGVSLAVLLFAGWPPVVAAWPSLTPAHAWLNLYGFVSLVIATTLLHFFPTVVGARIGNHRSGRLTVAGVALGAWLTAGGYAFHIDALVTIGVLIEVAGAASLVRYASVVWRRRGRWTTDLGWHRFAMGGLQSATAWFVVGTITSAADALRFGSDPSGWSIERIAGPLVAGWVGLAVLASATHLVPAIGPGGSGAHARQRVLLGQAPTLRLALLNLGAAALWFAGLSGSAVLAASGIAFVAVGVAWTAGLLAAAAVVGLHRP